MSILRQRAAKRRASRAQLAEILGLEVDLSDPAVAVEVWQSLTVGQRRALHDWFWGPPGRR